MAEDTCSSTCSEEDEGLFANDGNFLERFKRIQEEQKKQKKEEEKKKSLEPKMIKSSKEPTIPMRRRPHPLAKKRTKGACPPILIYSN
jgi:splicing factor 4